MADCILHQRLEQQRRNHATRGVFIDIDVRGQAIAESDFFNCQVSLHEVDFLGQRDAFQRAEAEDQAKKVGQALRHLARFQRTRTAH